LVSRARRIDVLGSLKTCSICNDANTPALTINVRKAIRTTVRDNTVRIKRNLAAGDDTNDVIQLALDAASADVIFEGNEIFYAGTVVGAATGQ
jgi:hypothetical protein